jgi:hypothetical protein
LLSVSDRAGKSAAAGRSKRCKHDGCGHIRR